MKVFVIHEAEIIRAGLRVLLQPCNDIAVSEAADLATAAMCYTRRRTWCLSVPPFSWGRNYYDCGS